MVVDEPSGADAGIPCVDTCAETLSEGGAVCASEGLAADFYQMLSNCACTGPGWSCGDVCGETYCVGRPPSPECDECLDGTCIKQWLGCTNT